MFGQAISLLQPNEEAVTIQAIGKWLLELFCKLRSETNQGGAKQVGRCSSALWDNHQIEDRRKSLKKEKVFGAQ